MRFFMFRTNKPRQFNYIPRYFNPEKEAWKKRKAELNLETELSKQEELRMQIRSKWHPQQQADSYSRYRKFTMIVYLGIVLLGLYLIFFTDMVENFLLAFGLGK